MGLYSISLKPKSVQIQYMIPILAEWSFRFALKI